ncbi:MAG: hypothetical protein C0594_15520, partial [Marinilabiliales bacterium]
TYDVSLTVTDGTDSDTETKTAYIEVYDPNPSVCETVTNFSGTPTLYGAQDGGYLAGNNGYGDLSKAEFFEAMPQYNTLDSAYVYFGNATGSSSTITFNVWDDNGGTPNSIIGSETMPISDIVSDVTNGELTGINFDPDITISTGFYIEVVLPTTAGDTLAIVTNADGEATTNTAWETWSDGAWHSYADGWQMDLNHAVFAVVCPDGVGIDNADMSNEVHVFPNPTTGQLYVDLGSINTDNASINIYNMFGSIVRTINGSSINSNVLNIDLSDLSNGLYILQIENEQGKVTRRVSIAR